MVEKGYDFYPISYGSLAAPKGVPDPIIKKLEDAFTKAKRDPSVVETLGKFQVGSGTLTGKQYADLWRSKYDEMGKVIKALGLEEK
jgi:tripartite-type tricarboxylate transporter receptor subunit TctC